ncbi:phospholipid transport system transporter-binding protein [Povalibacter uvarum]|uniref:Phospholipid transport system transporter-binding protein n=1 Tax=Povalibacter uvarum TaxID=732238 RepID=A0A841HF76_9GAMM|nr:STAS domain-containing protein [Povalibacter uvarum]MBB6091527.1 phospholipid transport system transporter-binding protein [Povalibacter uvarum]
MSRAQTPKAKLESLGDGRFRVSGILDASTVTGILEESSRKFEGHASITVDLSLVKESDSAGLALVLEWLRQTRSVGGKIYFQDVPQQIMALARISEVDDLLLENGSGVVPATPMVDAPAEKA